LADHHSAVKGGLYQLNRPSNSVCAGTERAPADTACLDAGTVPESGHHSTGAKTADMSEQTAWKAAAQKVTKNSPLVSWLAVALVCISLIAALRICFDRGLHDEIGTESWGRALFAIGAAVTQMKHGGYGYTLSNVIEAILGDGGLTDNASILAPLGAKFPENLRDPALINAAIDKAAQFKWPFNPNEAVRGSGGDDLGLVDYVRLSFLLFGFRVQSLFFTYFLILGISAAAFLYAFRLRPALLMLLVIACVAQIMVFSSVLFDRSVLGSIFDPRFLSALAIIPGLHLGCLLLDRSRPTPDNIVLTVIQSLILVFAIWIRSSASWVVVGVAALAALVSLRALLNSRFNPVQLWSLGVLLLVLAVHTVWASTALHPIYREKGEISRHVFWHAVFFRLQFHPGWDQKYSAAYDHARFDELPRVAALKYMQRHPPADPDAVYLTPDREHLKIAASETYVRKAFFEFLAADPKFVLESTFIYNPLNMTTILEQFLQSLGQTDAWQRIVAACVLVIVAAILTATSDHLRLFGGGVLVVTGWFLISLSPILLTNAHRQAMSDQFILLLITIGGWVVFTLSAGMRAFFWHLGRRRP